MHPRLQRDGGYWNDEAKTAEVLDAEGWMHTGDIAVMDEQGYVAITGRIKDMVIRGGRTSTRARSRNSSTNTPTSSTRRWSGFPTSATAKN